MTFREGTLNDEELLERSFDVVMAFNLLHLLEDLDAAVQRMHSLLKPEGLFISKTPCIGEQSLLLRVVIPVLRRLGKAPFVNFVKKDDLLQGLQKGGFEIIETDLLPAKSQSFFIVARKLG